MLFAQKIMRMELTDFCKFMEEAVNQYQLWCPWVVKCYYAKMTQTVVDEKRMLKGYMMLEVMEGGTLDEFVQKQYPTAQPPASVVRRWAVQLLLALKFMHERGMVHGDFKPQNVLMTGGGDAKIADLGLVLPVAADRVAGYSPFFAGPEIFLPGYTPQPSYDMFALGLTIVSISVKHGDILSVGKTHTYLGKAVHEVRGFDLFQHADIRRFFETCDDMDLRRVVTGLLHTAPQQRLTASDCLSILQVGPDTSSFEPPPPKPPLHVRTWKDYISLGVFLVASLVALVIIIVGAATVNDAENLGKAYGVTFLGTTLAVPLAGAGMGTLAVLKAACAGSYFLLFVLDIVMAGVVAHYAFVYDFETLAVLAVVYVTIKIITCFVPWRAVSVSQSLVEGFAGVVTWQYLRKSLVPVAAACVAQLALLLLGVLMFRTSPSIGFMALMAVFCMFTNVFRYCVHIMSVRMKIRELEDEEGSSAVLTAFLDVVRHHMIDVVVVSISCFFQPFISFVLLYSTFLIVVGFALAAMDCTLLGGLAILFGQGLQWLSKFLLAFSTKHNLTLMVVLNCNYIDAVGITRKMSAALEELVECGAFVTDNVASAHITNWCIFSAGFVFLIAQAITPEASMYAAVVTYMLCRTMLEPIDAFINLGFAAFAHRRDLIHMLNREYGLENAFAALNAAVEQRRKQHEALQHKNAPAQQPNNDESPLLVNQQNSPKYMV